MRAAERIKRTVQKQKPPRHPQRRLLPQRKPKPNQNRLRRRTQRQRIIKTRTTAPLQADSSQEQMTTQAAKLLIMVITAAQPLNRKAVDKAQRAAVLLRRKAARAARRAAVPLRHKAARAAHRAAVLPSPKAAPLNQPRHLIMTILSCRLYKIRRSIQI